MSQDGMPSNNDARRDRTHPTPAQQRSVGVPAQGNAQLLPLSNINMEEGTGWMMSQAKG